MSETAEPASAAPHITPAPLPLRMLGDSDAAMCTDGSCEIPAAEGRPGTVS